MSTPTKAEVAYMMAHPNDTKVPNLIACGAITLGLAYLAVVLRIVARTKTAFRMGADDYLIILSLVRSSLRTLHRQFKLTCTVPVRLHSAFCVSMSHLSLWNG